MLWSSSITGCDLASGLRPGTGSPIWKKHIERFATGCIVADPWREAPGLRCFVQLCRLTYTHDHYSVRCGTPQGYRIKPHGQLVLVSCTRYRASTPSLSTSWSRTTLQGGQAPGIPNLQTSFPLRCLQRLSLPYIATRQCHWHDNRYTSGTSTPVLSY